MESITVNSPISQSSRSILLHAMQRQTLHSAFRHCSPETTLGSDTVLAYTQVVNESGDDRLHSSRTTLYRIIQALERSSAVSYILDSGYRVIYCNPAWDNFAAMNGGPALTGENVIGVSIIDVIPDALRNFFFHGFARALQQGVWEVSYECSSPDIFRKYRMRVHALKSRGWLVVTNPLISESPHCKVDRPDSNLYLHPSGLITMCMHCRCSRRVDLPEQWDFVPDYLRLKGQGPLILSHGLCPVCCTYFYSK